MGQTERLVDLRHGQLLPQPIFALAERADTPSNRGHMRADGQGEAFDPRRVALPAVRGEHLRDCRKGPAHAALLDAEPTPPAHRLASLRIEQLREGHPARRGHRALAAWGLPPVSIRGQPGQPLLSAPVGQTQGGAVRGQHLGHLMAPALGHGCAAFPDVKRQQ
jgi:hypothetical protein